MSVGALLLCAYFGAGLAWMVARREALAIAAHETYLEALDGPVPLPMVIALVGLVFIIYLVFWPLAVAHELRGGEP